MNILRQVLAGLSRGRGSAAESPPRRHAAHRFDAIRGRLAALGVVGALVLLAETPGEAQTPWYQVEVVVFFQGDDRAWRRDNWREAGPPPLAENTVQLLVGPNPVGSTAGTARRHAFRALPDPALDLGAAVDRLERDGEYRVLLHVGWHQPGFPIGEAPGVHLSTPRGLGSQHGLPAAGNEAVDGTLRLWRRRFLHADADFAFGEIEGWKRRAAGELETSDDRGELARVIEGPDGTRGGTQRAADATKAESRTGRQAPPGGLAESGSNSESAADRRLRVARLTRSVRLREGRLHYIDHPIFGILLLVNRLD